VTATLLFTDLVGSTELLFRMGERAFDGFRRTHFASLRDAIAAAKGIVVKGTGDGVLATFASASRAISCAVVMQQAVDLHGRTVGIPLALRVGLSLGDVVFEDSDVFGAPVVEAARLVATAGPGQILGTALVRMVAGGRVATIITDVGLVALKGVPQPVAVCEVAWQPLPALASVQGMRGTGLVRARRATRPARQRRQPWRQGGIGVHKLAGPAMLEDRPRPG
jgi:class 3 adenylate cyclase